MPHSLHVLRGSKQAYRTAPEPKNDGKKPRAPTWLSKPEQALFRKVASQLHNIGLLGSENAGALGRYVRLFMRWLDCEKFIEQYGMTYVRRGKATEADPEGPILEVRMFPQTREARQLAGELTKAEREFGLTPAGRARLAAHVSSGAKQEPATSGKRRFISAG